MKNRIGLYAFLALTSVFAQQFQVAQPGYRYQFPRDYFSHPEYETEWWYYTGNLQSRDGHNFGFELTFFRSALHLPANSATANSVWNPDQIYLAHFAISDLSGHRFYHQERINRAGPGLAGADLGQQRYWNGNWQVQWTSFQTGEQRLQAVTEDGKLQLDLHPAKPIVINGQDGVSVKGPLPHEASHYLSFTRLDAAGSLHMHSQAFEVAGEAWMDHEFFTEPKDNTLLGWDWFSIQLNNHEELMLYRLRNKSGEPNRYSSGTFVDAQGDARFLSAADFKLQPATTWRSPESHAQYPMGWQITVPSLNLNLSEDTVLPNQELLSRSGTTPSYWEGAVTYAGSRAGQSVHGAGYLEMTGYGEPVWLGEK